MWYVVWVMTGKEEETKQVIERELDRKFYTSCFCIKRERVWRREGKCIVHLENMFPGYLFINSSRPKEMYEELKKIPKLTKVLKEDGEVFLAVSEEEELFLRNLLDGDAEDVVRLSKVLVNKEKEIVSAEGPLKYYVDKIVKQKLRLRYVLVEVVLFGKKREVLTGIEVERER